MAVRLTDAIGKATEEDRSGRRRGEVRGTAATTSSRHHEIYNPCVPAAGGRRNKIRGVLVVGATAENKKRPSAQVEVRGGRLEGTNGGKQRGVDGERTNKESAQSISPQSGIKRNTWRITLPRVSEKVCDPCSFSV